MKLSVHDNFFYYICATIFFPEPNKTMKRILLIYTGGTIGMKQNPTTGALAPVDFAQIESEVPELHKFGAQIDTITFDPVIDSSNLQPKQWGEISTLIKENYEAYDGFVVLHGTDTMSYSASALSFMLENLAKPVIFTGSQIPMGVLRTDGRENLITAIEIAVEGIVKEVCVYFQTKLMRGNRTTKQNSEHFDAFQSHNYPPLATAGIHITYNKAAMLTPTGKPLIAHTEMDSSVVIIKIFPGITAKHLRAMLSIEGLKAVVLESYGAGNSPSDQWFLNEIATAIKKGIYILNVTQCAVGSVNMQIYETGRKLQDTGVISGVDITTEAAMTKLMYILAYKLGANESKKHLIEPIRGEFSII